MSPAPRLPIAVSNAELESHLAQRLGKAVRILEMSPLGADGGEKQFGYGAPVRVRVAAADGTVRQLVVHRMASGGGYGHDGCSDRAAAALLSYETFNTLPRHVAALDVGAIDEDGSLHSLAQARDFYVVTEFGEGNPYAHDLEAILHRGELEGPDLLRVDRLAMYLSTLHGDRCTETEPWLRRLRAVLGGHEGVAGILDGYDGASLHGYASLARLHSIEHRCLDLRHRLQAMPSRLCRIHGDFHPWNVLFDGENRLTLLDRSRGEWGDAADDVAALTINYVFFALRAGDEREAPFLELWKRFYQGYLSARPDPQLGFALKLHLVWRALVVASPVWYPALRIETRRRLFLFIEDVLAKETFEVRALDGVLRRRVA